MIMSNIIDHNIINQPSADTETDYDIVYQIIRMHG